MVRGGRAVLPHRLLVCDGRRLHGHGHALCHRLHRLLRVHGSAHRHALLRHWLGGSARSRRPPL